MWPKLIINKVESIYFNNFSFLDFGWTGVCVCVWWGALASLVSQRDKRFPLPYSVTFRLSKSFSDFSSLLLPFPRLHIIFFL